MGGKTKQAQRTKNNVRPSSSGRSVEILNKMNLDPGLMMGSGNSLPTLFPTLTALSLDSGLNPEYQMCMKKLNKKDPITRTKALQELLELVNKSLVEDVVQALPSWTYFYKILTADTDRKVREMTQMCHGAIVAACGRQVAPHLKQLLPAWLQAQHDDHAPAQAHAQKSLNSTFPDKKLPEVMSFCKAEVMAHFLSSLIGNADLTLIKKSEDAEERELQQCRIVASSLQGLQFFSQHLPAAHERWLWAELAPLLQSGLFWRHASHSSPTLRAAWYAALGRIIERFKATFGEQYGAKSLRLLLGAAHEHDSLVAAQLWGCLLLLMHNVEDWHKYLDKKNLLCKRILDVLENGGWGDAKHLSNILLPLLAHLPGELLSKDYYETFFAAMLAGLDKKTILSSKSERQYWITSLADCLRYLSVQQDDYVVEVASYVHRAWLKKILNSTEGQAKTNLIKWSANNMASLVKYWLKQSKETNTEHYEQLVRNFWQNIGSTITMQIETVAIDNDEISKLVNDHIMLIQTLNSSLSQETKKQHTIKFDDSLKMDDIVSIPNQQCDISIIERYKHNLDLLVELTCLHYFDFMRSKQVCSVVLTQLFTLLVEFDSRRLFDAIARQYDFDGAYKLYDNVLRTWLSGDTMRCKVLVDVVFLLLKHLSEDEQKAVFNSFQQFPPPVVEWCISLAAAHPHSRGAAARAWLRGRIVREALAHVCRRLVAEGDCSGRNLLLMCLSQDAQGEVIIGSEAVSGIVETFSAAIADSGLGALEQCAAHAALLASTLPQQHHGRHYTTLVVNLFQLNILVPRGDSRLSVDTWCEVRSSWQDGLAALAADERQLFMAQAIRSIHENAFQDKENINVNKLEHIVSMCPYLLDREEITDEKIIDYVSFTKRLFDFESESVLIETYALRNDCVLSNFNCPFDETRLEPDINELERVDLIAYVNKVLFRALYLRTMLLLRDEEERHLCDTLLSDEYFEMEFCKLAYDFGIVSSLDEGYTFWLHYALIEETKQKLTMILEEVINEAQSTRTSILSKLTGLAASEGYYWATARTWCESKVEGTLGEHQPQDFSLENAITGNGFIHTLQANAKQSRDEEVVYRTKYLVMLRSLFASDVELAEEARARLAREAAEGLPGCSLDLVVNAYYMHNHIMLYERDLSDVSWRQVLCNAAIVEFLVELVERRGWEAPAHHWDFTTITLCSLLTSVDKSKHNWGSTKISMLARSVLRLLVSVRRFVEGVGGEALRRQPSEHVAHLPTEWADIFAPDLDRSLFSILLHILESSTEVVTCSRVHVLAPLSRVQWRAAARDSAALRRAAAACACALARPHHHAYKYLAYGALRALADALVLDDGGARAAPPLRRLLRGAVRAARGPAPGGAQPRRAGRADVRGGGGLGQPRAGAGLAAAGGRGGRAVRARQGRPRAPLYLPLQGVVLRGAADADRAAAAARGGAGGCGRARRRRRRAAAARAPLRRHQGVPCLRAGARLGRGRAGVPLRVHGAGRRGVRRRARLVGRRGAAARAPAAPPRAHLRGAAPARRAVRRGAAQGPPAGRQRRGARAPLQQRGGVRVHGGRAAARAAADAVARPPAGGARGGGAGRGRARRQHALAGALPRLPERHRAQRAAAVDARGGRQGRRLRALLHLLLPAAPRRRQPAARRLPPVQEQVPPALRAKMVYNEQNKELSPLPRRFLRARRPLLKYILVGIY